MSPEPSACRRLVAHILCGNKVENPIAAGEFSNIQANPIPQLVSLPKATTCRFIRFLPTHLVAGDQVAVAELGVTIK